MNYRKDIDGLRAIAVSAVVFFHGNFSWTPGGYVGVDIFFAISGFLITSIMYPKMLSGTFSFSDFYIRRARRLLPASVFMIAITLITFALVYPPDIFITIAKSALAALTFCANIFFWQTSGYFSSSVELQPLLHTWSLSVEEQFYFIVPLLMYFIVKYARNYIKFFLAIACVISLVLAIYYAPNRFSFISFYVLPTRFYEMGLGALVAIYFCENKAAYTGRYYLREIGLVLILIAVVFYSKGLAFPSFYPLLPVIGTLLIIADRSNSGIVYQLLVNRLMVGVGLISYSLYLWHWPVKVLLAWYDIEAQTYLFTTIYLASSTILALISYYLIEQPMRHAKFYNSSISKAGISVAFVTVFVLTFHFQVNGNKGLLNKPDYVIAKYTTALPAEAFRHECTDRMRLRGEHKICKLKYSFDGRYNILLWGDSHASSLMTAIVNMSSAINVSAFNTSGCPSLLGVHRKNAPDCAEHNLYVKDYLTQHSSEYDLVLHASAWNNYIEQDLLEAKNLSAPKDILEKGFKETAKFYQKLDVNYVFLSQFPRFGKDIPLAYFKDYPDLPTTSAEVFSKKSDMIKSLLGGSKMMSLSKRVCDHQFCYSGNKNFLYYRDSHHISVPFGKAIAMELEENITRVIVNRQDPLLISNTK